MREIKFRAWDEDSKSFVRSDDIGMWAFCQWADSFADIEFQQYTGLKDKNGDKEIYECDIIDTDGNVIGNQYEAPALLEEKTNLLIQGFGTKDWLTTYSQAVERGCHDA